MNRFIHVLFVIGMLGLYGCGMFGGHIRPGEMPSATPYAQDHFIDVGGVSYHYCEYSGPGSDILMVHGFGSSTYTWEKVAPLLQARGYHVWALDMKGFGWSDKPAGVAYDAHTLMEEVNTWMDAVGLSEVIMVGNSLGGEVTFLMAMEHPEKVSSMVLVDAGGYPHKKPTIIRMAAIPGAAGSMKLVFGRWVIRWSLKEVFFHNDWVTEDAIENYYERMRTEGAMDSQVAVIRGLDFDALEKYTRRIPSIDKPTLIIHGRDDTWIPLSSSYKFKRDLSNATLVVLPDCGHVPQEEYPRETGQLILDFIAGKTIEESLVPGEGD